MSGTVKDLMVHSSVSGKHNLCLSYHKDCLKQERFIFVLFSPLLKYIGLYLSLLNVLL